jgi:hypothetical protein
MSVSAVQSGTLSNVPQQWSADGSTPTQSSTQSAAHTANTLTSYSGPAALDALPKSDFFQSLTSEAPKLLLGLIPGVGSFLLLGNIFAKVAEFAGTAKTAATVEPNRALNAANVRPKTGEGPKSQVDSDLLTKDPKTSEREREGGSHASAEERVQAEKTVSGRFGDASTGGSGSATCRADAGVRANAVSESGPNGARVAAGARAELGVSASARGEIHGDAGSIAGEANAYARVYAEGSVEASAGPTGARAKALAATGAEAGADAVVVAETAPLVKVGDYEWKAGASAQGKAVAGAGANADAEVTATYAPPELVGKVGARAFAGARAAAQAQIGTGPFRVEVGVEGRAGAGVEANFTFSLKDGRLEFGGMGALAAALGLGVNFKLSIDFQGLTNLVAGIFQQVATDAPDGHPGQTAASTISQFVQAAGPYAQKAFAPYSEFDFAENEKKKATESEVVPDRRRSDAEEAASRMLQREMNNLGKGARSRFEKSVV